MTAAPNRHWFRFSLRTLFVVVTLVAIGLGIRANWQPNWIKERHALLECQAANAEKYRGWQMSVVPLPTVFHGPSTSEAPPRQWPKKLTQTVLWFYGEPSTPVVRLYGNAHIGVAFWGVKTEELFLAERLFPEATLQICAMRFPLRARPIQGKPQEGRPAE